MTKQLDFIFDFASPNGYFAHSWQAPFGGWCPGPACSAAWRRSRWR